MVTIIVETNWPAESSKKLAETWLGMETIPEQMTMHYVGTRGESDCERGMVIWHIEDSYVAEALKYINKDVVRYYEVPGFGYSVCTWTDPTDALAALGMA